MRVVIAYNLKRVPPLRGGEQDDDAEYDGPATIAAIAEAIGALGHEAIPLEADDSFPRTVVATRPDVVFNVAEGRGGRGREAQVPSLLELLGVPYTGSDPASLVFTLDKWVAKSIVREVGIATPRSAVIASGDEPLPRGFTFPAIVKPVAEGSSKGVTATSVAIDEQDARRLARSIASRYASGALVEEFLPGREFTVAIVGAPLEVLPPMEIVLPSSHPHPVYGFDHKLEPNDEVRYEVPAQLEPELERALRALALRAFHALGCRDVARVDIRLDGEGQPSFIECNPLPGLTPGWSDLCLIAAASGIEYPALIGRILESALRRAGVTRTPTQRVAAWSN